LASFGRMLRVFSLLLFVFLLLDSVLKQVLFFLEEFVNGGPEWENQRGKKTLLSLTPVLNCAMTRKV